MKEIIMKYIAINSAKYGKPDEKAVIGKVIAENPELKSKVKEVIQLVKDCIKEFESLSEEDKKALISKYASEEKKKEERELKLPPLPEAEVGKVIMRFAPNPNGPPTLGSARGIIINGEYCRDYKGKYILRFDDTDPKTKRPILEAYDWYIEDFEWLGYKPDEIIYASKRIHLYYDYAKKLIELGGAYACFCKKEEFKKYRDGGIACSHRNNAVEDNLEVWEKMLEGAYDEGEVVLRIKTDMTHKDPAVRDWVAFRIIYTPHPLVGDKYCVYPMLDFESAIEDHLCKTTHILRGKDLRDSELRQRYIYEYFGWRYPITIHWGRVNVLEFGKLSTSLIRREIEAGNYAGWDDPRLPTVKALRRRGITAEAIRRFYLALGLSESEVNVSMKSLYAENRKIVDPIANRYFFVADPIEIEIKGLPEEKQVEIPLNPNSKEKRVLHGERRIYISREDFEKLKGENVRLKDFCNVILDEKAEFVSYELLEAKKGKNIIHWLPKNQVKKCRVVGEKIWDGFVERGVEKEIGKVVQFERFGFCKIEKANEEVLAIYTHD
ncbi:MAG: glutamate--tRNA ligase [Archaeoglobaceae archaeon]|nr:glutamate--tRNA ligase [Archaeoglobaceae archaeon]MDW8128034.1 glutamate--tRNA ligase [Archaeoglobaceae archaeon]